MKISSPFSPSLTFVLDPDNSLVPLHCSIRGNPIPQLQWSKDSRALDSVQLPTGFNQSAISVLMINVMELGLGNHTFQCNATLDALNNETVHLSSSLMANISIQSLLKDIRIVPESLVYNFNSSSEEDRNRFVLVNCSVRAYPHEPRFEWSHSRHLDSYTTNVTNYSTLLASVGIVYWSVLRYPLARMMNGANVFTCHTYDQQITLNANAAITILIKGECFAHNFAANINNIFSLTYS